MFAYIGKILLTTLTVVAVAELAKRHTLWAALLASLPLTTLLALIWLYVDTGDNTAVAALTVEVFWLVLASLPFFVVLPAALKAGWGFWPGLGAAAAASGVFYLIVFAVLRRLLG